MDDSEVLCHCFSITAGDIKEAIENGASTFEEIQDVTGFGSACGSCLSYEDTINEMLENN